MTKGPNDVRFWEKRTCPIALQMSASDPKRTFVKVALGDVDKIIDA